MASWRMLTMRSEGAWLMRSIAIASAAGPLSARRRIISSCVALHQRFACVRAGPRLGTPLGCARNEEALRAESLSASSGRALACAAMIVQWRGALSGVRTYLDTPDACAEREETFNAC